MSPRCPECDRIQTGIDATADGHEIQPCGCAADNVPLSDLESPFVDRGRGTVTDGGEEQCGADGPAGLRCTRINGHDGSHKTYRKVGGDDHHIEWWECNPVGDPVEDGEEIATDGGRTIVGDPSHPAETASPTNRSETADMSELSEDFAEDFDGPGEATVVPCRQCGAKAGEPCEFYGGEGAGEPRGSPHSTRGTDARSARGEGE